LCSCCASCKRQEKYGQKLQGNFEDRFMHRCHRRFAACFITQEQK
jgi:hypothetical protein